MTVSAGGVVKWSGTLADGTKVSQTSAVSKDGLWPLYRSIYGGGGAVISWMQFNTNLPASDLSGQFIWIKPAGLSTKSFPAGFTNSVEAVGSAFTPATAGPILNLPNLDLVFSGGGLQVPFTNSFSAGRPQSRHHRPRRPAETHFLRLLRPLQGQHLGPPDSNRPSLSKVWSMRRLANGAGLFLTLRPERTGLSGRPALQPITIPIHQPNRALRILLCCEDSSTSAGPPA